GTGGLDVLALTSVSGQAGDNRRAQLGLPVVDVFAVVEECTMSAEVLSRIQFALTISFHFLFPPMTIGLGVVLVVMQGLRLWTVKQLSLDLARFWTRVFGLIFAIGVATGIPMEFQFGTNWGRYARFVGDVLGSPLAVEGIYAFFLESGFLAFLLFGWNRIGPRLHLFSTCM